MGNTEGGRSRSSAHASFSSDSPRNQSKSQKVKSPSSVDRSQSVSPGATIFYDSNDSSSASHTCKPDVVPGSKDIPAYYFTASQLRSAKKKSKSHDTGLNRVFSVTEGQNDDVRHMAWSTSYRSDSGAVSMIYFAPFL